MLNEGGVGKQIEEAAELQAEPMAEETEETHIGAIVAAGDHAEPLVHTLSQLSPCQRKSSAKALLRKLNTKASAAYDALLAKIKASPEPSVGYEERIYYAAMTAWNDVQGGGDWLSKKKLAEALSQTSAEKRGEFYEALCE